MNEDIEIEINAILRTNRNILERHYAAEKIHTATLLEEGFVFEYRTHEMKHQDGGHPFAFCYEYGIGKLDNDWYEIIRLPF